MDILIADDDLTTRTFLKLCLEKNGHNVIECENGQQALDKFALPDSPSLGIIDWTMPVKSGPEVVKTLRETATLLEKYIIMLSAKSHQNNIVEGLNTGANDYIVKPFHYHELMARIQIGVKTIELQKEVAALRELLPICAWCKSVKGSEHYWESLESYLSKRMDKMVTHGICDSCQVKLRKQKDAG